MWQLLDSIEAETLIGPAIARCAHRKPAVSSGRAYDDPQPVAANIKTPRVGCHSLRATGITAYMKNGGRLEVAQQIANHESPRTTKLYDRSDEFLSMKAGADRNLIFIYGTI